MSGQQAFEFFADVIGVIARTQRFRKRRVEMAERAQLEQNMDVAPVVLAVDALVVMAEKLHQCFWRERR